MSQPQVLEAALRIYDLSTLEPLCHSIQAGEFDRIILTGMGASLYAVYPSWLILARQGLPAYWVDAAEILHYTPQLVTPRTLLWIASQSGRSAELIPMLDPARIQRPACLLATVNELDSPLAQAADLVLPIHATPELTVSTRTYVNTLGIAQLTALALASGETDRRHEPLAKAFAELEATAQSMASYLKNWEEHVVTMKQALGMPHYLAILGRGPSMAAVLCGSLIMAEASKTPTMALNAAEFRHGPLEMAGPRLSAINLIGPESTAPLNRRLTRDLLKYRVNAFLISSQAEEDLPVLPMPHATGIGLPLAEIIPMQMLTIALAEQQGLEPGKFYQGSKVVLNE